MAMEQLTLNLLDSRMERTLKELFSDGRAQCLFGEGPARALETYRCFSTEHVRPFLFLEMPLLGTAYYDVLLGNYAGVMRPQVSGGLVGCEVASCQAAMRFVAERGGDDRTALFFELDFAGGPGQVPAMQLRHDNQLETVAAFFAAIGESWRTEPYRKACSRLPKGWSPLYAGIYPGRPGDETRLEVSLSEEARKRLASGSTYVRECLDQLGFTAFDDAMLGRLCELAGLSAAVSVQLGVSPDASMGSTLSLCSVFERSYGQRSDLFGDDGPIGRVCCAYERMNTADERWRQVERALFVRGERTLESGGLIGVTSYVTPCCGKAKWTAGVQQASKIYLIAGTSVIS